MEIGLESHWGIGPKTREKLVSELGIEGARDAILNEDFNSIVAAGVSRGRAFSILRKSGNGKNIDSLGSIDSRGEYRDILRIVEKFSVSPRANNKIKIITPMNSVVLINEQLDLIFDTVEAWKLIPAKEQELILKKLGQYGSSDDIDKVAVEIAICLHRMGSLGGVFQEIEDLDMEVLLNVAHSMSQLKTNVHETEGGEKIEISVEIIEKLSQVEENIHEIMDEIRRIEINSFEEFKDAVCRCLSQKTGIETSLVRESAITDEIDADEFILGIISKLKKEFHNEMVGEKKKIDSVHVEFIEKSKEKIGHSVESIDKISLYLSLSRFSLFFDLSRPLIKEDIPYISVKGAKNIFMMNSSENEIKKIDYCIGKRNDLSKPNGKIISVLTGMEGSGKTTLLETIFQIATMSNMGLPVPAESVEIGLFDSIILQKCSRKNKFKEIRELFKSTIPPILEGKKTLLLIDEMEMAIGMRDAPKMLMWILRLAIKKEAIGIFSTNISEAILPLENGVIIEGILNEGSEKNYQPVMNIVAKHTIEFVMEDIASTAKKRIEVDAYRELDILFGDGLLQMKLNDPKWNKKHSKHLLSLGKIGNHDISRVK